MIFSEHTSLCASDGHSFDAYVGKPGNPEEVKGALVVLQEIFGLTSHIRAVVDGFAAAGYLAVAPALYDRVERQSILEQYDDSDVARGRALRQKSQLAENLLDIEAARLYVARGGKVGVVGYCWGGNLAWASSAGGGFNAAVVYYGGAIPQLNLQPQCPVMAHFGERDILIPPKEVQQIRESYPDARIYTYDADHGFNCDLRGSFDEPSAQAAYERTLGFLRTYVMNSNS